MIEIIDAGFLSTIQDLGRFGYSDVGITRSGAMDEFSYLLANKLLDDKNQPCIEITYGKFEFKVFSDVSIAICGVEGEVEVNNLIYSVNRTIKLKKGDIVKIKPLKKSNFLYLCFKGGIKSKKFLGSYSVSLKEKFLSTLKKGDILKLKNPTIIQNRISKIKQEISSNLLLRVILGYQKDLFDKKSFFNQEFDLISLNRQGAVLKGNVKVAKKDIISDGINYGSIQALPNGNLAILLKEHQTIGGFPKIGVILPIDCFKLSQLRKAKIIFKQIDLNEAKEKMRSFYNFFY